MKRVLVLGCCGSGKSTFSKKLHEITGLELVHLDQHYWKAGWVETEKEPWEEKVAQLANKESWIMDGNYGSTIDVRIARADTVFYLDHSTIQCLWRISKRIYKYNGTERPDMPEGCKERFDLEFYHYVATFNLMRRKPLLDKLKRVEGEKSIHIFNNDQASETYLNELRSL